MRANVSTTNLRTLSGAASRLRVIPGGLATPNFDRMAQRTASGTPPATEREMRDRLAYWVKDRMGRVGIDSVRDLAREMGVPSSTAARWFGGKATAGVPLIWMGDLCRVLRVDPAWFVLLPPIPADQSAPYALPEDDPLIVALDAARLARRVTTAEAAEDLPFADLPPLPPRRRAAQGAR